MDGDADADTDARAAAPHGVKRPADDEPAGPRRIQALDPNVVNKIAAGEIIIAPVHALKELVENAVDAGATALEVLVKDGGLKLLQITDNGCGIAKDDLPILCERFTTSKLQTFEDLSTIATYGFRGEALASISHIAHLTVTTRTRDDVSAWRVCYEGGRLVPAKPGQGAEPARVAGRPGTQITVEDLFYNVPTRRRAFRSPADEYGKIVDMLGRYAVHCGGVAVSCKKHGEASASLAVPAAASTVDRIRHVYGGAVAGELLALATADPRWGFRARGWASTANHSMKRTTLLLFINGRSVESAAVRKALDDTYALFLPKHGHPFVYLSLDIDPRRVDVNVHPTKREVHFLHEDEIVRALCDHLAAQLAAVDTSRTFSTQTLLSGAASASAAAAAAPAAPAAPAPTLARTPAARPYENNLVRTDTNLRKITSMFAPAPAPAAAAGTGEDAAAGAAAVTADYETVEREPTVNWLKSVRELKEAVVASAHGPLTDIFRSYTFVGIVDERRRLAAIQSGVRLYLVDYGRACFELFYQRGLHDFGNLGVLRFRPPLDLRQLLRVAWEDEPAPDDDAAAVDPDEAVEAVAAQLVERRQMLHEYFSLELTPTGELRSLPLLVKGYTPPLAKLPRFLLRLGPRVCWTEEKACFDSFLRELASFYVPEPLPVRNEERRRNGAADQARDGGGADNADNADAAADDDDAAAADDDDDARARRAHVQHAVEHVLFPAFKTQLICTASLMQAGLIEVANLKGLYRVFERC